MIFKLFFADRLGSKFATNLCLNIPPRLKHVATLPCEIRMSEKWRQSEICTVINDKSQGSIAKHLRNNELVYYKFINLPVKEFLKLVNVWQSYRQNGDRFMHPTRIALLFSKTLISPDKLNNLCITERNCY